MRNPRRLVAPLALLCLLLHVRPADAAWIADVEAGVVYEDNVNLAEMERDIRSDTALGASVSAGGLAHVTDSSVVSLTGDVIGAGYTRFGGLSNLYLGVTAAFRTRFGLGATAPWVRVAGSAARLEYREDVRDGWRYRGTAGAGKRFGERWDVRLEYAYDHRTADHEIAVSRLPGDVFDQTSHTLSARVDYLHSRTLVVFAGYALRLGDVASTTPRNAAIFAASSAVTPDPAFGPEALAYKIDATTHILSVGLSFALGEQASFNLGYERQIGLGDGGIDYHNNVFRASFLYSY
jgi:hypothetical protein